MVNKELEKEILELLQDRESRRVTESTYLFDQQDAKIPAPPKTPVNYPDAKKHQIVSFVKSAIRIVGYCFIPFDLVTSAFLLILSEIVGIIEELV